MNPASAGYKTHMDPVLTFNSHRITAVVSYVIVTLAATLSIVASVTDRGIFRWGSFAAFVLAFAAVGAAILVGRRAERIPSVGKAVAHKRTAYVMLLLIAGCLVLAAVSLMQAAALLALPSWLLSSSLMVFGIRRGRAERLKLSGVPSQLGQRDQSAA